MAWVRASEPTVEEESWLLQVVLWPSHMCSYSYTYTHKINEREREDNSLELRVPFFLHVCFSGESSTTEYTSRISCYLCPIGRTASASLWSSGAALFFRSGHLYSPPGTGHVHTQWGHTKATHKCTYVLLAELFSSSIPKPLRIHNYFG